MRLAVTGSPPPKFCVLRSSLACLGSAQTAGIALILLYTMRIIIVAMVLIAMIILYSRIPYSYNLILLDT